MSKVLLSYKYASSGYPNDSYEWSFTVFARGTIWLRKKTDHCESSYKLRIPHDAADKIHAFLTKNKAVIDMLPKSCGCGCDGWLEIFSFLGKEIVSFIISYDIRQKYALKRAGNILRAAADGSEESGNCADNISSIENIVLELFMRACRYLREYGLSVGLEKDDKRSRYKHLCCTWDIPDRFYSFSERFPLWEYNTYPSAEDCSRPIRCSAALYCHGTLQLKFDNAVYWLKVRQSAVDKMRDIINDYQLMKMYHQSDYSRYSMLGIYIFCISNKTGLSDENFDVIHDIFQLLEPYGFEVLRTNVRLEDLLSEYNEKRFQECFMTIQDELYELRSKKSVVLSEELLSNYEKRLQECSMTLNELKPDDPVFSHPRNSILCQWHMPELKNNAVLLKAHNNDCAFTIYENGLVHLTNKMMILPDSLSDTSDTKLKDIASYFYLPQRVINKLRTSILQYLDEIQAAKNLDSDAKTDAKQEAAYTFMGMDIAAYSQVVDAQLTEYLCDICGVLKPYGFISESWQADGQTTRRRYEWPLQNIPNFLFLRPKH